MTTPITSSTPATTDTSNTALGKASLVKNFDTFLALLTTQLKNQDPLSPLDSNQFTQQLVQMSGVEQQLMSNDLLTKLVSNTGSGVATAVGLIGKQVRATSDVAALSNGKADWIYNQPSAAADVKVEVLDGNGRIVHAEAVTDHAAGDHAFSWNGKDLSGNKLPDGDYTLRVTATDEAGAAIATTTSIQGVVSSVEQADGGTYITINGGRVTWDKLTSIKQATAS